ncbi:MAG: 7-cyano-7-deazaguanine synthase QueC, partial [Woeseiaceae bacterium]|nr:7-cyano-7-deazaguanine synthase QueC [Woeseiaceae bacterium]
MKTASAKSATEQRALVLLSGGQDSTTCLFWALDRFGKGAVDAICFDYGQRHRIEIDAARQVAAHAGVPLVVLPIDTFSALGGNSLVDTSIAIPAEASASGLPGTFVPGRNLVFLTYAAAYAWRRDIRHLVTGVAQTDYSGYPDCRQNTITALQRCLRLGMERNFKIHAPLMHRSKKQTVELAASLGALEALRLSHTCYNGKRPPCGSCAACLLRAKGFAEAGIADPLLTV